MQIQNAVEEMDEIQKKREERKEATVENKQKENYL